MRMTRSLLILATTSALAAPRRQSNQISSNYPLLNSHIVTLTGTGRTVGEAPNMPKRGNTQSQVCEFTISLAPNEWAKEVRGLPSTQPRFNPDGTCEGEFEVGTPPDSALPPQTVAGRARAARNLSSPYVVGVYRTSSAYGGAYYPDPIQLWVNSEQLNITWGFNNRPTVCPGLVSYSRSVPASAPGWYTTFVSQSAFTFCTPTNPPNVTGGAGANDYATWEDDSFPTCVGPVYAYYTPLNVYGDNFGNIYYNFAWYLVGSVPYCVDLLTPNVKAYRTSISCQ